MIKSVISDLGNVLVLFDNSIFFNKIAEYSPLSVEDIVHKGVTHLELSRSFDMGHVTPDEFYTRATQILKAEIDKSAFFSIYNDIFTLSEDTTQLMRSLSSRYTFVLCSNTDVERFGFIKTKFPEVLFFDKYVVSYEVGFMKPHPRIYEVSIQAAGTRPEESVFIDDREENIIAAGKLGLRTIHFGPETHLEKELFGLLDIG